MAEGSNPRGYRRMRLPLMASLSFKSINRWWPRAQTLEAIATRPHICGQGLGPWGLCADRPLFAYLHAHWSELCHYIALSKIIKLNARWFNILLTAPCQNHISSLRTLSTFPSRIGSPGLPPCSSPALLILRTRLLAWWASIKLGILHISSCQLLSQMPSAIPQLSLVIISMRVTVLSG